MIYSLSEIDANCKKAARGAGLSWGYAEEAGKAARWLAAYQLPGAALLAQYLTLHQKKSACFQASPLSCPLLTGAALCDAGYDPQKKSVALAQVAYPLLLLPYLVQLSQSIGKGLRIQWPGVHICCFDGLIYIKESTSIASSESAMLSYCWLESNECSFTSLACGRSKGATGQFIDPTDWILLETLAHFTYVPATEASRRGAGPAD